MKTPFIIDIHSHSSLQPFGHTFSENPKDKEKQNIWYYNPPKNIISRMLQKIAGVSAFSQANFTACAKGNTRVVGVSLYSPEISFFKNELGESNFSDNLENLATRYSKARIHEIQKPGYDYFKDLQSQYEWLKTFNNQPSPDSRYRSVIAKNFNEIRETLNQSDNTVVAFTCIEGGHCFGLGYPPVRTLSRDEELTILNNIETVKNWEHKPLYITLSHHFYNQLSGHCRSIPGAFEPFMAQDVGINTPFTKLGKEALLSLLDNTSNKRIIADIKHLSQTGRREYYRMLDEHFPSENIPILFSHAGMNGIQSFSDPGDIASNSMFNQWDINLFDCEIKRVAESRGLIGCILDQRILSSSHARKQVKELVNKEKKLFCKKKNTLITQKYWSTLLWNNMERIALVLDKFGMDAFDNITIGSDYDGTINPLDGFLSEEEMPVLMKNIKEHVHTFLSRNPFTEVKNKRLTPEEILEKIMCKNALSFLENNYR